MDMELLLVLYKHPEHSWCLCWCHSIEAVAVVGPVFDPFHPEPPTPDESWVLLNDRSVAHGVDVVNSLASFYSLIESNKIVVSKQNGNTFYHRVGSAADFAAIGNRPAHQAAPINSHNYYPANSWIARDIRVVENLINGRTDPIAVYIVPHLIHLPPSVPEGRQKPWWWNEVQQSHANWLDTFGEEN